jgi:hypothetical protein
MVETESDGRDGTVVTTGKSGLLDAATAQRLGGNYDAYGNWHSTKYGTVSKSGPLAAAQAYATQMGVNTAGWATSDFVNFSKNWKSAAQKGVKTTFTLTGGFSPLRNSTIDEYNQQKNKVNRIVQDIIYNQDTDSDDQGPTVTSSGPSKESAFDNNLQESISELGFDDSYDDDDNNSGGGTSFSGGMGIGDAGQGGPGGYGESYGSIFARGGRVGMQAGGMAAQPAGFVQGPPGQFSERETVADDQPMEVPEGTFVINAPAVEHAGSQDIRKMILDAYTVAQEKGLDIGRVDRKLYEGTVDVALSKGEVVIPPELAKIIGYDRLEKINNRGKKEVSRRQEASEGGFLGLAEGGTAEDPLGLSVEDLFDQPEDPAEYEDRIILDEVQRKMDALVKEYEDKGVDIRSIYDRNDPLTEGVGGFTQKSAEQTAFEEDIPPNFTGPFFSGDDYLNQGPIVNVPKTPSLGNLFIMAEEFAHQGADKRRAKQEQGGMSEEESLYAEEIRAKRAAFETVQGLLPQQQRGAEFTLNNYGESFLDYIYETTSARNQGRVLVDLMRKYPELEEAYKRTYGRGKGLKELEAKVAREEENVRKKASGGFISMAEGGVTSPTRRPKREQLADIELRADLETFIQGDALARLGYKLYEDGHVRFNTAVDTEDYGVRTRFKGAYFPPGNVRTDKRGVIPIRDIDDMATGRVMEEQGIAPSQLKSDAGRVVLAGNIFDAPKKKGSDTLYDASETTVDMITIAHEFRHAALDYLSKTYDLGLPTLKQEERIMDYADNQAIKKAGKVNPKLKERYFSNPDYKIMSERGKSAGDSAYLRKQYEQYTGLAEEILEAMDVPPQSPAIEKEGFLTRTYKSLVN